MSLTDEDKQWIAALLTEKLKQTEERMATREQLEQALERMATRVQLEQAEERMAARIERVETALLTEFHKWASPMEMRMRSHSAVLRTLDLELEKKLEDQK